MPSNIAKTNWGVPANSANASHTTNMANGNQHFDEHDAENGCETTYAPPFANGPKQPGASGENAPP